MNTQEYEYAGGALPVWTVMNFGRQGYYVKQELGSISTLTPRNEAWQLND